MCVEDTGTATVSCCVVYDGVAVSWEEVALYRMCCSMVKTCVQQFARCMFFTHGDYGRRWAYGIGLRPGVYATCTDWIQNWLRVAAQGGWGCCGQTFVSNVVAASSDCGASTGTWLTGAL